MKCIKSITTDEITKVSDSIAEARVLVDKTYVFIPKQEWKEKVRDVKKVKEVVK